MLRATPVQRLGCLLTVAISIACATSARGQCETQKITPADGMAGDLFGSSVDVSGDTMIVGAPLQSETVGAAYIFVRTPMGWLQEAKLGHASISASDEFGRAVSISGDNAAVGTPLSGTTDAGRVYMFRRTGVTWANELLTTMAPALPLSKFGTSVSVDGDAVLVGVPESDEINDTAVGNSGSAYVFRRNSTTGAWAQEGSALLAGDASEGDQFGFTVLLRGNTAFVTSFNDKDANVHPSNTIGSVYVFTNQSGTWTQTQRLVASDAAAQAAMPNGARNFGRSLGVDGNTLIVGEGRGQSAYVFRFNGSLWVEETILKKPATSAGTDQFGNSVAINGDIALVGAAADDDNSLTNSGTIFVFKRIDGTWTLQPLFYGSSAVAHGRLGTSLASRGTYAVAGEIQTALPPALPTLPGAAYVLAVQPVPDCDGNSIQDECELHSNPAADSNQNGVLDTCECFNDTQCNDNVSCTNNVCNTSGPIGQCEFPPMAGFCVIVGVCHADGVVNPSNECQVCTAASAPDAWSNKPDDTPCTDDGNECRRDVCLAGTCSHPGELDTKPCGDQSSTPCDMPNHCDDRGGICLGNFVANNTPCPDMNFCNGTNEVCDGQGLCVAVPPLGCDASLVCVEASDECVDCVVDADCADNPGVPFCLNNVCVQCSTDAHCPDDGNECTDDGCNLTNGLCTSVRLPSGSPCGSQVATDCDLADTCNAQGMCQINRRNNNTPCTTDNNACNGAERCQSGVCTPSGVDPCASNQAMPNCVPTDTTPFFRCDSCLMDEDCDDLNDCTSNMCVAGACQFPPLPLDTACGSPISDPPCNLPDSCNGLGLCLTNHAADTVTTCPDADLCNGTERCQGGACVAGPTTCILPLVCNPVDGSCQCTSDGQCADGLFCNGVERCVIPTGATLGICQPAADTVRCKKPTPVCVETAGAANTGVCRCGSNADCDDSLRCNGTETCVSGACQAGTNPCASGLVCNEQSGAATHRCDCNDDGDCNQTLFCAPQVCTSGQCVAGPVRCPTGQQCDERNNRCATCLSSDDAVCDDDDDCTLDTCPAGQCVHTAVTGCNDADRDGVPNSRDRCPATSPGAVVDANGCADFQRDSDADGVNDDVDECPGTAVADREDVDRSGCALNQRDSDGDAVTDDLDACPDSPEGSTVDDTGCADEERDDDGDGILNGDDRCGETPAEAVVDIEGCAVAQRDSDNDGVSDDVDECPATVAEAEVDAVGCEINDPDNNNGNGNGNTNGNDNEPGQEVPGGTVGLCGAAGLIGWFSLFTGFIALRLRRLGPREDRA